MGKLKVHNLKIKPEYFKDVISGRKNFEVRFNDRNFKEGDIIVLEEFDNKGYTGKYINCEITYVLSDAEYTKENYVVLGIKLRLDRGGCYLSKIKRYSSVLYI